jgi:flagellin
MALSILNNIAALSAQNQISMTQASLQKTLFQLSSGSRINSGADDAAGLAIADGLHANISALTQSARNASDGIGKLQVADGALSQVTTLLNRAVTLATEAANGTVNTQQRAALDAEFSKIKQEIGNIGSNTTYNGGAVFGGAGGVDQNLFNGSVAVSAATPLATGHTLTIVDSATGQTTNYATATYTTVGALVTAINADAVAGKHSANAGYNTNSGAFQIVDTSGGGHLTVTNTGITELGAVAKVSASGQSSVYVSDGTSTGSNTINVTVGAVAANSIGFSTGLTAVDLTAAGLDLTSASNAQATLAKITQAVGNVAADRGTLGATMNQLTAASNVMTNQVQNLTTAEDGIRSADVAQTVANMTKFNILNQTGISALAQANQMQQGVLTLLR